MNQLKKYFNIISGLSTINRFSQSHLSKQESVLEHIASVAQLSYFIGSKIKNINMESLLKKAIFHDIDEIITGDLAHPTKHYSKELRELIKVLEEENMADICDQISHHELYGIWLNAKDDTMEGNIIGLCDMLVVLYKIEQEYNLFGNNSLLGHSVSIGKRLRYIKDRQPELTDAICDALQIQKHLEGKYNEIKNYR